MTLEAKELSREEKRRRKVREGFFWEDGIQISLPPFCLFSFGKQRGFSPSAEGSPQPQIKFLGRSHSGKKGDGVEKRRSDLFVPLSILLLLKASCCSLCSSISPILNSTAFCGLLIRLFFRCVGQFFLICHKTQGTIALPWLQAYNMKHFYADSAIPPATLSGQPSGRTVVQGADEEEETDTKKTSKASSSSSFLCPIPFHNFVRCSSFFLRPLFRSYLLGRAALFPGSKREKIAAAVLAVRHKDALGLNVLSTSCSRPEKRESDEEGAVVDDVLDFWAKLSSLPLPPPLPQEVGETVFASAQIRAARSIAPICHQPPPIL